jgi:hypothetical protein
LSELKVVSDLERTHFFSREKRFQDFRSSEFVEGMRQGGGVGERKEEDRGWGREKDHRINPERALM